MAKNSPETAFQRALEGTAEPEMDRLVRLAKALEHMQRPPKQPRHLKMALLKRLGRSDRN